MMRHHQCPGGERHEFPCDQEGEGVVGQHDEVHAGQEGGKERQHPGGRPFVLPVAEREQARRGGAEIDDGKEEGGQRIRRYVDPERFRLIVLAVVWLTGANLIRTGLGW